MRDYSYIFNAHPSYVESMYQSFKTNPLSVDEGWRLFFEGFEFGGENQFDTPSTITQSSLVDFSKEFAVMHMIEAFRSRGHLLSTTNPLKPRLDRKPYLLHTDFGLTDTDLSARFQAGELIGMKGATLQDIINTLFKVYCGNIGYEFAHIENREKRLWLKEKIENSKVSLDYGLSDGEKERILRKLNGAVIFEKFLHTKYVGQKRFSLEGGETTIAAIDAIINTGAEDKVDECILAMAHRGRLNVLANIMGKTYDQIFNEFEGTAILDQSFGDGDVKYHLGYSSQVPAMNGKVMHLKLVPNPSHLEAVNPVMEGFSRAKADLLYQSDYDRILPIVIHGDSAVAGQGVVYETVQFSQLKGYYTGGTIHFIINNQIGFTTNFEDARSSTYSSASASLVQAPVFHVNGDDPEAVVFACKLAVEYRQEFNNDVFIDMVCYRRHGHNEGDDPKFTQPRLYELIDNHKNPREIYLSSLVNRGDIDAKVGDELEKSFWNEMQERLDMVKQHTLSYHYQEPELAWRKLTKTLNVGDIQYPVTGISITTVQHILDHLMTIPKGFNILAKIKRLLKSKQDLLDKNTLDWALAELLGYGSLINEGKNVRMSGQDVKRGTFSHRHAVFFDEKNNVEYNRLDGLSDTAKFMIYNSLLSEFAVLGFEYGYSQASPDHLTIWEAQFGDFYNGAQTIVDQFIMSSESKWQRMSGLLMLLPHGMEGQGPEHSSARIERFLQNCANFNMIVCNVTTPANFFHLIRRQLALPYRKPCMVASPKSLLRHPDCVSPIEDFIGESKFKPIIEDETYSKNPKRILFCSGKIYYDLNEYRRTNNVNDVAIVRIEQLYPLPEAEMRNIMDKNPKAEYFWVQEEPENMGAWNYLMRYFRKDNIDVIARQISASPATGFKKVHDKQQENLVLRAFGKEK
ncbi:MAG: 2-oxoglutarate dehydrogenase E1 component [Saprospiraceae bacterium]